MSIHARIHELAGLAQTYAEDGAFRTAANVYRQLADEVQAHAEACDKELFGAIKKKGK
jgi:lipopolysaccharide biosynthesis regulator YciM